MKALLASVRRKLLGETLTIPLGVSTALALALLTRAVLPHGEWQSAGGFALAAMLIVTLIRSLSAHGRRPRNRGAAAQPNQQTTTRSHR